MTCYICKDEPEVLYKICSCVDSLLCIECLELSNNNINGRDTYHENMLKCSICRQFLEFNYYNKDYYKNVVTFHLMVKNLYMNNPSNIWYASRILILSLVFTPVDDSNVIL